MAQAASPARRHELRLLRREDGDAVWRLLDSGWQRDIYLRGLVWRRGVTLPPGTGALLGHWCDSVLRGVFLHSPMLAIASQHPLGARLFAGWVAERWHLTPPGQLLAPRDSCEAFLSEIEAGFGRLPRLRLLRPSMPSMVLEPGRLVGLEALQGKGAEPAAPVRRALPEDFERVRAACRAVTIEELGIDPEQLDGIGFRSALMRRVRAGREYVRVDGEQLLFRAAISSATPESVLVEGVFTPPEHRGQGHGTRGMHALCTRLLPYHRRIVLFVASGNDVARRLYRRLGFEDVDEYQAVYFDPSPPPNRWLPPEARAGADR